MRPEIKRKRRAIHASLLDLVQSAFPSSRSLNPAVHGRGRWYFLIDPNGSEPLTLRRAPPQCGEVVELAALDIRDDPEIHAFRRPMGNVVALDNGVASQVWRRPV